MSNAKDVIEILIGLWANIIVTASFIVAVKKQKIPPPKIHTTKNGNGS